MPASARLRRLVVTLTLACLAAFATAAPALAQVPPIDCLPFEGNPICGSGPDLGWIWDLIGT